MSGPTPRQVLYALVSAGFLIVTVVLTAGAAFAGLVPPWWTAAMVLLTTVAGFWSGFNWRRTGPVLLTAIGLLLVWVVGTLAVS
jgi:hypothetical protein